MYEINRKPFQISQYLPDCLCDYITLPAKVWVISAKVQPIVLLHTVIIRNNGHILYFDKWYFAGVISSKDSVFYNEIIALIIAFVADEVVGFLSGIYYYAFSILLLLFLLLFFVVEWGNIIIIMLSLLSLLLLLYFFWVKRDAGKQIYDGSPVRYSNDRHMNRSQLCAIF